MNRLVVRYLYHLTPQLLLQSISLIGYYQPAMDSACVLGYPIIGYQTVIAN